MDHNVSVRRVIGLMNVLGVTEADIAGWTPPDGDPIVPTSPPIHPARRLGYEALAAGLATDVAEGRVKVVRDGPLALYKYSEKAAFDRDWTETALLARGLILDVEAGEIVATPFPKFFNFGEGHLPGQAAAPLPNEPFDVTDKCDGSLSILFHHGGRWRCATRGSFISEQAKWAENYLYSHCKPERLIPGWTYLAEVIYPENRIVINYGPERHGLTLLTAYDSLGFETDEWGYRSAAESVGFHKLKRFSYASLDDLLHVAKSLSANEEGFVVRFASGLRVKIKGDEYCRVHRLVSRITPLGVYDWLVEDGDVEKLAAQLPEEFRGDIRAIWGLLTERLDVFIAEVAKAHAITAAMSDRDLGMWLSHQQDIPSDVARRIFPCRKKDFLNAVRRPGHPLRKKACELIRPTGNVLPGYVPSTLLNRVFEES